MMIWVSTHEMHKMKILKTASYGLLTDDCVLINWFCTLPSYIPDDVVRCISHIMMFST